MRAAVVKSSEELAVADVAEPVCGAGQVLIENEAIGAGYVDVMARRGEYYTFPGSGAVPGVEVVGRVAATGPGVPDGLVGERVLALLPAFGGYAERTVADTDRIFPVPEGAAAADVIALGTNALVAETAVHRAAVSAGERVLVRGAGGGIGVLATQFAHARGAEVTAVTSSPERAERLRTLGATHVVDRTRAPHADDASYETEGTHGTEGMYGTEGTHGTGEAHSTNETHGTGGAYDVVVDTVAGPALEHHLRQLGPNGRYVLCGAAAGLPAPAAFAPLLTGFHDSPSLLALSLNSIAPQDLRDAWQRITALLRNGALTPVIDRCLPLAEADAALRRVAAGGSFGKVVLLPR